MQIDVVIATCNRKDLVVELLRSLQASTFQKFQAWVVDQSDDSTTADAVEPILLEDSRFHYIHSAAKGVNLARNVGIIAGKAPLVALTDDDCRVSENWLEALVAEYEACTECDSVFGQVLAVSIAETAVSPEELKEIKYLEQILPMASKDSPDRQLFGGNRLQINFGHGANMSFRRATFSKFGLFDEFLGAGAPLRAWPELDLGHRILAGGGKILYSPTAIVFHLHWRTWSGVKNTYRNYAFGTGAAVGKYVRTGDWATVQILKDWLWHMGVRKILSGLLKYRSWQRAYVGWLQLIYPWVGLWQSRQYVIDPQYRVYLGKKGQVLRTPTLKSPTVPDES